MPVTRAVDGVEDVGEGGKYGCNRVQQDRSPGSSRKWPVGFDEGEANCDCGNDAKDDEADRHGDVGESW